MTAVTTTSRPPGRIDIDQLAAVVILFLLPITTIAPLGLTTLNLGLIAAVAVCPVMVATVFKTFRRVGLLLAVAGAALVSVPVLIDTSTSDGSRLLDTAVTLRATALLVRAVMLVLIVLWARSRLAERSIAMILTAGMMLESFLTPIYGDNPWKYALAWPATLFAVAAFQGHHARTILALLVAAGVSLYYDSRGYAILSVIAALIIVFTAKRPPSERATNWKRLALVGGVTYLLYRVFVYLAIRGDFGTPIQMRTQVQTIKGSGSALLGARPEFLASTDLFRLHPWGLGPGVSPSTSEYASGVSALGFSTTDTGTYVSNYIYGDAVDFHSVVSDLWVNFGLAGLLLAVLLLAWLTTSMTRQLALGREASSLAIVAIPFALTGLLFSPLSSLPLLMFAIAITWPLRTEITQRDKRAEDPVMTALQQRELPRAAPRTYLHGSAS